MANCIEEVTGTLTSTGKGTANPLRPTLTYDEIATKLLNEKLLLTALELHAELCEAGKEIPILRDFFSNPSNFESQNIKPEPYTPMPRSSSQATLDSLDMTRYSEDGAVDERVAILEFELRKARENISALRANLTVVTESESTAPDKNSDKSSLNELPIKPHEQRALNFLVNEYLLARSYKLTSITFSDENENQDFEDWQDVGLNIPKPPELVQIYRDFMRASGYEKPPSISIAVQTDFEAVSEPNDKNKEEEFQQMLGEIERLKAQSELLIQEKCDLQNQLTNINAQAKGSTGTIQTLNSSCTTPDKFEVLESPPRDISNATQDAEEDDSVSVVVSLGDTDPGDKEWTRIQLPRVDVTEGAPSSVLNTPSRNLPTRFKMEIMMECLVNTSNSTIIEEPLKNGVSRDRIIDILSYSLPRIVPNVILNKREEVIPLILSTFRLHPDTNEREKLLQLLFNLKKKPQEEERRMILAGLITIAKMNESPIDSEEILTLCWEQSQHKYVERRLLAVECCSALAPYTSSGIRNSLMLSMLQQMLLEDKEPTVRATVVRNVALLVALMDDPDKYFQCEELALTALHDTTTTVVATASSVLLPILAQWACTLRRLQSHLLSRIIIQLKSQLKSTQQQQQSPRKEHNAGERIVASIGALEYLLPYLIVYVADNETVKSLVDGETSTHLPDEFSSLCRCNIVNPRIFYEGDIDVGIILNTFFANTWQNDSWEELDWLTDKLIPDLLEMVKCVEIVQESILLALLSFIRNLCVGFGHYITQTRIQPVFLSEVTELEKQLTTLSAERQGISLTLIPVYLTILSTLNGNEVSKALKQFLVVLSMSGTSITCLQIAIVMLCRREKMQEHILAGLWDGVVHQRPNIRCSAATLFGTIIAHVSDRLVTARVAPGIVTLATDSELEVRAAAIPALARLVTECKVKEARDKARLTLETIAREPQGVPSSLAVPLVSALAHIAPNCPQNYVEDVIATQLTGIAASALQQSHKVELTNALVEAYSILVYCPIGNQCITNVLLPGLKYLENLLANNSLGQHKETVRSLLREIESRQDVPKPMERSSSLSSGLSLSMATVNVGQGVEDMRQRMSKIFQQKANSPSIPSIFRKK